MRLGGLSCFAETTTCSAPCGSPCAPTKAPSRTWNRAWIFQTSFPPSLARGNRPALLRRSSRATGQPHTSSGRATHRDRETARLPDCQAAKLDSQAARQPETENRKNQRENETQSTPSCSFSPRTTGGLVAHREAVRFRKACSNMAAQVLIAHTGQRLQIDASQMASCAQPPGLSLARPKLL